MTSSTRTRPASPPLVLLLTSISFFMVSLDALVVVTALPAIHASVGGSVGALEWTVNAYSLPFAAGIITAAALGDRLGHRRVYVTGLALFTVASAACALAPNASLLIAARAVQGVGSAAVTPLALTILTKTFPANKRGSVMGIFGGISGLAVAGGPLVGGVVVQGLDWHWIFWINVPIGILACLGSALFLPAGRGPAARLDLPAVPLIAGGMAVLGSATPAGATPTRSAPSSLASRRWPGSCCGNSGLPSQCSRCGCSGSGRSRRPAPPGSSRWPRSSPPRS